MSKNNLPIHLAALNEEAVNIQQTVINTDKLSNNTLINLQKRHLEVMNALAYYGQMNNAVIELNKPESKIITQPESGKLITL